MTRSYPVTVRFRDLDALGHVNSGVFLAYMEAARVRFVYELFGHEPWYRVPLLLASARCEYKRPVTEPADLAVRHWVSRVGGSSYDIDYTIEHAAAGTCAIGRTTQVWFDHDEGKTGKIPPDARAALEAELGEPLAFRGHERGE